MKDKIMLFVIGVLVGAVIASGAFVVYSKSTTCNSNGGQQISGGNPPSMPSGQNGQPPEKPSDNNTQDNNTQENSQ